MDIQERIAAISEEGEIWKPCPEFEEKYLISSHGRVIGVGTYNTCKKGELISLHKKNGRNGYMQARFYDEGRARTIEIHTLVAKAFISNPNNLPMVNHIDEDKTNNHVENLEWCDNLYNIRYSNAKAVDVYTKEGEFVETLEAVSDAAKKYNTDTTNISRCCKSQYGTCNGYQFRYHGDLFQKKPVSETALKRKERAGHDSNESRYVALFEYAIDGTFITAWPNSNAAAKAYGIAGSNIRKCGRGEINTIGGKIFLRQDEDINMRLLKMNNRKHKSKSESRLYELQ